MIRRATLSDVGAMVDVLRYTHARSIYAGKVALDERKANAVIVNAITRHGFKTESGTWCMVSERDGEIDGLIIGALQPVYQILADLCTASDLFWVTTAKASARDKVGLMLSFVDWAKAHRKVFDIICATPPTAGDPEKAGKIMRALGFEAFGGLWRIEAKAQALEEVA